MHLLFMLDNCDDQYKAIVELHVGSKSLGIISFDICLLLSKTKRYYDHVHNMKFCLQI